MLWKLILYLLNIFSQTDQIAELAGNLTPVADIAALLDLDLDELRLELANPYSPVRKAYLKARAATSLMLRKQEIELAKVGSPLAVQLTNSYLKEMMSTEDF